MACLAIGNWLPSPSLGLYNVLITTRGFSRLMQHGSPMRPVARGVTSRHRNGAAAAAHQPSVPGPAEVTDIIPFDEFGRLDDALFGDDPFTGAAFDGSADVLSAPELDDLTDTDNMPV